MLHYTVAIKICLNTYYLQEKGNVSLDLARVASQIGGMIARLRDGSEERQQHLQCALDTLSHGVVDLEGLKKKIASSKTTWLVADLVSGLNGHYAVPLAPSEFTVMATDGSQIDVDRHRPARCYLINIGSAVIHYGTDPDAVLTSVPNLYSGGADVVMKQPGSGGREQPVEGALLGIKRAVEECRRLVELGIELPPNSENLALLDGSLILWGLEAYPEFVADVLLYQCFISYLDDLRKLNQDKRLALASYISFPRSTDVVNMLRVALCPHEVVDSDRDCPACTSRECDAVAGVGDRELFLNVLGWGERSEFFISQSSVVQKHYGGHKVYFFYLKVGDEIARVEIPRWVAEDDGLLNLAHALILDQCRRGQGYPVALSEAHEQAVVTGVDRENFWQLVESSLVAEHMPAIGSAKSFSKRTRWV